MIYERVGQAFDHIRVITVYTLEENKMDVSTIIPALAEAIEKERGTG